MVIAIMAIIVILIIMMMTLVVVILMMLIMMVKGYDGNYYDGVGADNTDDGDDGINHGNDDSYYDVLT